MPETSEYDDYDEAVDYEYAITGFYVCGAFGTLPLSRHDTYDEAVLVARTLLAQGRFAYVCEEVGGMIKESYAEPRRHAALVAWDKVHDPDRLKPYYELTVYKVRTLKEISAVTRLTLNKLGGIDDEHYNRIVLMATTRDTSYYASDLKSLVIRCATAVGTPEFSQYWDSHVEHVRQRRANRQTWEQALRLAGLQT